MDLTVVIPTYNEAKNITILVERTFKVFHECNLDAELIIVDDDSPDRTWEVAQQLKSTYCNLEVLRRFDKRGLSSAVLDGIQLARGNIIGVMDADLSHPPEKIPELVKPIMSQQSDLVIGSRYVKGGDTENWPFKRKVSSKLATLTARGLTQIKDPMSGFFFLKKNVIEGVELNPKGFKIGLEILVKGRYKNATEIPILFRDRKYGASKLSAEVISEYLSQILRLYAYKLLKQV
jgi:dolichol-phosphate mannosyltransferase